MLPAQQPVYDFSESEEDNGGVGKIVDKAKRPPLSVIPKLDTELYPKEIDCCIMATD